MIRQAVTTDIPQILDLLYQVQQIHADGRPDLFKAGEKKYSREELELLFDDADRPIYVAVDGERLLGYAFCIFQQTSGHSMQNIKTLYIDDLCVSENVRGQAVGSRLYEHVLQIARSSGCYNVTLNVWALNEPARKFYEKCGMNIQKYGMETIL